MKLQKQTWKERMSNRGHDRGVKAQRGEITNEGDQFGWSPSTEVYLEISLNN